MSDEPKPPPLRLKPRLRPDGPAPAEPSTPPPEPPAAEPAAETLSEDTPKLRLKPRLKADPTPESAPAEPASGPVVQPPEKPADEGNGESSSGSRLRLKPRLLVDPPTEPTPAEEPETVAPAEPPPPPEAESSLPVSPLPPPPATVPPVTEAPKFKLKVKTPASAGSAPVETNPPSAEETPIESSPPEPPPPPNGGSRHPMHPPVVHLSAPEAVDEEELVAEVIPPPEKPRRKIPVVTLVGLILVLGLAGVLAWQKFMAPPPPPPSASRPVPKATKAASLQLTSVEATAADVAQKVAATPDELMKEVVEARAKEQARVDALAEGRDPDKLKPPVATPSTAPTLPASAPVSAAPAPTKVTAESQTEIAPNVTATTTTVMAAVEASPAFKSFVAQMQINGVFQGTPARALINGHTYREGELIDPGLGISFDHIDAPAKLIVFRDRSGALVQRKY